MNHLKLLFRLYFRPAEAMSEILDTGGWLFAAVLVLLVSIAFFSTINAPLNNAYRIPTLSEFYQPNQNADDFDAVNEKNQAIAAYQKALSARQKIPLVGDYFLRFFTFEPNRFYQPLLSLTIFYVPAAILLICIFGGSGNFGLILRRDYGALAVCALMSWAAAHLPFALAGVLLYSTPVSPFLYFAMWLASSILFGVFMIFALRTVFGASYAAAILTVCCAWLALVAGMYVFRVVSPLLFSPFLLVYAYMYLGGAIGGEARGVGNAFRSRQNFKRFLNNATVNPKDADARVQLALIYLQRRQESKALEYLNQAVAIDPNEIDANYELGKLARARSDLQNALDYFSIVVGQNDKYALSEIWREIGATYLEANMFKEAREALEKFVERRPVDSEGLYYLGKVYKAQGDANKAREAFEQAVEAERTSPDFRRRQLKNWGKLARKEM